MISPSLGEAAVGGHQRGATGGEEGQHGRAVWSSPSCPPSLVASLLAPCPPPFSYLACEECVVAARHAVECQSQHVHLVVQEDLALHHLGGQGG